MPFTTRYSKVLAPFLQKYKEATNEKGRKTVLDNAVDAVRKSKAVLEDAEDLPKELPTVVVSLLFSHFRTDG